MHLSSSVHARNQYPSLCHITPKALSTSIGLHTAAGTNRRSTRELDKMQHISENDTATPKMVDRATFQADVDARRKREKAHKIGRAAGRERVCQYVEILGVAGLLKKKIQRLTIRDQKCRQQTEQLITQG